MSADSIWQAELRGLRSELREIKECLDGHDVDLYRGKGPYDKSVVQRLADAEGRLDRMETAQMDAAKKTESRQKELRNYIFVVLGAVLGDLAKDLIPIIAHALKQQ